MRHFALTLLVAMSACGFDPDPYRDADELPEGPFQYEFNSSHCSTGRHEFSDYDVFCASLRDEPTNSGCARSERLALYDQNCG